MTDEQLMSRRLEQVDPEIAAAIHKELERQNSRLELIASENFTSEAMLEATGSVSPTSTPKATPASGTTAAANSSTSSKIWRANAPRSCSAPSTPTCNRTPARKPTRPPTPAYCSPGDTILGMNLAHGGHLTHGHPLNFSGKTYKIIPYGVRRDDERIDYDEVARLAQSTSRNSLSPEAARTRASSISRSFREIADSVGALFMVDMAHFSGLVAAGVYPNPCDWADIVTSTTHKTLRGPRSGMILCQGKVRTAPSTRPSFQACKADPWCTSWPPRRCASWRP